MGEDNLQSLPKWKNYEVILERYQLLVYPRVYKLKETSALANHDKVTHIKAPIMEISSTFIRNTIKEGKNIRPLLPAAVWKYIDEMGFYL
jgi:nicotinate-nucleotide adenylyltransferase